MGSGIRQDGTDAPPSCHRRAAGRGKRKPPSVYEGGWGQHRRPLVDALVASECDAQSEGEEFQVVSLEKEIVPASLDEESRSPGLKLEPCTEIDPEFGAGAPECVIPGSLGVVDPSSADQVWFEPAAL